MTGGWRSECTVGVSPSESMSGASGAVALGEAVADRRGWPAVGARRPAALGDGTPRDLVTRRGLAIDPETASGGIVDPIWDPVGVRLGPVRSIDAESPE